MSKKNAFLIHLGASFLVFIVLLLMIIYVWYPAPYFDASYRMKWIIVIAFVDLVIGPGLTLIVFSPNKPSLKFDMSVILVLQLSALSWGVYNAWSVHPQMNVFFDNEIYCLDHTEISNSGADVNLASSPVSEKLLTMLPYPETVEKKLEYLTTGDKKLKMVYRLGGLFEKMTEEKVSSLGQGQRDFMSVVKRNDQYQQEWDQFISAYGEVNPNWKYFTYNCFKSKRTAVFDTEKNKVEALLDIELPFGWALQTENN